MASIKMLATPPWRVCVGTQERCQHGHAAVPPFPERRGNRVEGRRPREATLASPACAVSRVRYRRVPNVSQKTFSLNVPWNGDLPWIFSTAARIASRLGACAWISVLTIGTSIRWFGSDSDTKTVGTSVAYHGISAAIGVDQWMRTVASWAKPVTLAKTIAASYVSAYAALASLAQHRVEIDARLALRDALPRVLEDVDLEAGPLQLFLGDARGSPSGRCG